MGDWHKDNFGSSSNLESIVRDIVDEEIFPAPKNRLEKLKQGIEKFVFSNSNVVIQGASATVGALTGVSSYYASSALSDVILYANPQPYSGFFPLFMGAFIGISSMVLSKQLIDRKIKKYAGEKICGINEKDEKREKMKQEKKSFLQKYHLPISLTTGVAAAGVFAQQFYHRVSSFSAQGHEIATKNPEKIFFGISPIALGFLGLWTSLFYFGGKLQNMLHNKGMPTIAFAPAKYPFSKEKQMRHIKEEAEKGNIYALERLAMLSNDFEEKLDLQRRITEKMKDDNIAYGSQIDWLKLLILGGNYLALQKKKHNPANIMTYMALLMYPSNPDRAVKSLNKLSEAKELNIELESRYFRNVLLNANEKDQPDDWEEFIEAAKKHGRLEYIEGTEGSISFFSGKMFLKKNFISKRTKGDKSEKFFTEVAIHKIMKGSGVSVEQPLFKYDKDYSQTQIFLRTGDQNLRQHMKNMSTPERRKFFEKIVPLLSTYQERIFSAVEKKDGLKEKNSLQATGTEFSLKSEFRGSERKIILPVVELEANLRQRAFYGYSPSEVRLGENDSLKTLLSKISEYRAQKPYPEIKAFCHGDAFATNITEKLCFIDPRPRISHPLYDFTYISIDPAFIQLGFSSKKEKVLEMMLKRDEFKGNEKELENAFDYFYLHNAICLAGSQFYHKMTAETEMILDELVKFSTGKPFKTELMAYLKESNAKGLIKPL